MRVLALLTLWLLGATSLPGEPSAQEAFDEIMGRHEKIESYFAVYEGEAPGGKSLSAAISSHLPAKMASVQTQFFLDGEIVADPMQAITPDLGIVITGQEALHLKDAPEILAKLAELIALLFGNDDLPLGIWSPALSMTQNTMAAQLSITSDSQMPWIREGLPDGTTHEVEGELTIFRTPEGAVYRVQNATGILQSQNFPNEQGDRTLVLKDLQTGLTAKEISTFISGYVPKELKIQSMRNHPLLGNIQHQMLRELVAEVDDGHATQEEVASNLEKARPLLYAYFNAIYPPDFWPKPGENVARYEMKMEKLRETVKSQWKANGLKPEGLHPKTGPGKVVARLLTSTLRSEFLAFLKNKTTVPKSDHE